MINVAKKLLGLQKLKNKPFDIKIEFESGEVFLKKFYTAKDAIIWLPKLYQELLEIKKKEAQPYPILQELFGDTFSLDMFEKYKISKIFAVTKKKDYRLL